ncbi:MAG: M23 family metallopeptidase [Saprospiraceae bacterium]|nr:M23 family metallopeptidase [Saprospiraceae bacterium]
MPDGSSANRSLWDRLRDNYRITVVDDENLEEVASYNLSLMNFYIFISVIASLLSLLVISFIVFTPVKRLIPGYGEISENKKFLELTKKVDFLEKEIAANDVYTEGLKNLLSGGSSSSQEITDTIQQIKERTKEIISAEEIKENRRAKELNFLHFSTPVFGKISAHFQPDIYHYGVDILAEKDSPVKSIMDGVVINSEWSISSGNTVYIQHPRNVVSVYKHNSALLVKTGDIVKTGQAIAIIGNSGEMSTGPHLHFELWYDGKYVNPVNYITFN